MIALKRIFFPFFVFSFLILTSCKDSGSPESITQLFLLSLNKLDYTTANNISTKNTRTILKIMEKETKGITEAEKEKRGDNFKIQIHGKKMINDSLALVSFTTVPQILPLKELKLMKIRGKLDQEDWKVEISTLDIFDIDNQLHKPNDSLSSLDGQIHPDADSIPAEE